MQHNKIEKILNSVGLSAQFSDVTVDFPIALSNRYEFLYMQVKGSRFFLIQEKREGSFETLLSQLDIIKKTQKNCVLIFKKLSDEKKKILLKANISYIDYKQNFFIPEFGLLFSKDSPHTVKRQFLPSEQKVFIVLLLSRKSLSITELSDIADISIPSIYRAVKFFREMKWIELVNQHVIFKHSKKETFKEIEECLINPITSKIYIHRDDFEKLKNSLYHSKKENIYITGDNALALSTMLSYSQNNLQYAMVKSDYKNLQKSLKIEDMTYKVFDSVELELWKYRPVVMSDNRFIEYNYSIQEELIDPISLYISKKDDEDPRIEEETILLKKKIIKYMEDNTYESSYI